jgi:hypothetical protein
MVMFVFSQYSFQKLVKEQYPDERDLTNFNSFFIGAVYGISLIMQTFVNPRIISNYGLRVSLFILPLVMIIFSIASVSTGSFLGFEKSIAPAGFIYFFLFISLSRLFNWTLRDSLENPVFKLFFTIEDRRTGERGGAVYIRLADFWFGLCPLCKNHSHSYFPHLTLGVVFSCRYKTLQWIQNQASHEA